MFDLDGFFQGYKGYIDMSTELHAKSHDSLEGIACYGRQSGMSSFLENAGCNNGDLRFTATVDNSLTVYTFTMMPSNSLIPVAPIAWLFDIGIVALAAMATRERL